MSDDHSTTRAVPAPLKGLIRELVETADPETGTDELESPARLQSWLSEHGLLEEGLEVTEADFQCAIGLREAVREVIAAEGSPSREAIATLNWIASKAVFRPRVGRRGRMWMEPAVEGVDAAIAHLLLSYHESQLPEAPPPPRRQASVADRWLTRKPRRTSSG